MYDVQPADEPGWSVPPFAGQVIDKPGFGRCLVARGARNTKGPLGAFINAVSAVNAVHDRLPVNLLFVVEGEEEQGSRHLPGFVKEHQDLLGSADAMFFPHSLHSETGRGLVWLGSKGLVYAELECSGKLWGRGPEDVAVHSSYKAFVDSPVWRLVHALSTLTAPDGNDVEIEGFYDAVREPTAADRQLMESLVGRFTADSLGYGIRRFIDDLEGLDLIEAVFFSTGINIDGIWGGYTGPGSKTVLPHEAKAKLDIRLVPDQDGRDMLQLLRRHLDAHGYADIKITDLGVSEWSKCSVNDSLPQAVIRAYRSFGIEPEIWPMNPGTAPFYIFNRPPLNLPICVGGLGCAGRSHAPNEYLVVDGNEHVFGLAGFESSFVAIMYEFADN
jgi:acetylornithine deacetylase/succinyl-diaminopimelate desuccinylase-like protein